MMKFDNEPKSITLGYDLDKWNSLSVKEKISLGLSRSDNTHILIIGQSGSGKSYVLQSMLAKLILSEPNGEIYFADFKGDDNFSYLRGCPRYFNYKNVFNALDIVYGKLCVRLSGEDENENPVTFIFDEYVSAILSQQAEDKRAATQSMSRISETLLMGRSCGKASIRFWCFSQRCDSIVFPVGSRENFGGAIVALGNISKELKGMMFSDFLDDFEEKKEFKKGEGRVLMNGGANLYHIKIPTIRNMDNVKHICKTALSKPL